jgi:hypothetical protein
MCTFTSGFCGAGLFSWPNDIEGAANAIMTKTDFLNTAAL